MVFNKVKEPALRENRERSIVKWALTSRAIIITLQFVSNIIIPDHNADAFVYPKENLTHSFFDSTIQTFLGGFIRWDAQYFMHIARYGYTFENAAAFFPLFPTITWLISTVLSYLLPFLNIDSITLLMFVAFNVYVFVEAARVLYKLSCLVKDVSFAYKTSILFCFNPASIFFSAPYTECLFCYLTFKSIMTCANMSGLKFKDVFACIIYVGLSAGTRSNGILNIGFFVYFYVSYVFNKLFGVKDRSATVFFVMRSALSLVIYIGLCAVPFAIVQFYTYSLFCASYDSGVPKFLVDFARTNHLILPGLFHEYNQTWCHRKLPLSYSHVQEHYWNVGFLRYYELKQVPNFLLALPVVYIVLENSVNVFRKRRGFFDLFNNVVLVCTVHVFALMIFCVFFIHVQVTTRMVFSASPAIYWFCAESFASKKSKRKQLFLKYYFLSYFVVGTVMFCNYLPWT